MLCPVQGEQDALLYSSQIQALWIQKGNFIRFFIELLQWHELVNSAYLHVNVSERWYKSVEAHLWFPVVQVVTAVIWSKPDSLFSVPVWIIILAVLAGLLLLSLLIYLLYKVTTLLIQLPQNFFFLKHKFGKTANCSICMVNKKHPWVWNPWKRKGMLMSTDMPSYTQTLCQIDSYVISLSQCFPPDGLL